MSTRGSEVRKNLLDCLTALVRNQLNKASSHFLFQKNRLNNTSTACLGYNATQSSAILQAADSAKHGSPDPLYHQPHTCAQSGIQELLQLVAFKTR
jgi:hypothetical protein